MIMKQANTSVQARNQFDRIQMQIKVKISNVVQTFFQIWSTFAPLQLRERKKKLAVGDTELVAYVDASRRTVTDTMGQKVRYWCWHWLYSLLRIFEETYWSTGHEWRMKHWRKETIWSENIGIWKQTSWEVKRKHHLLDGCSTVDSTLVLHGILPWSPVL